MVLVPAAISILFSIITASVSTAPGYGLCIVCVRLYNEERLVDKTRVTCLKWVPGHGDTFLVSHASGQLYTYQAELECGLSPPQYTLYKQVGY